jgi:formiminotetrahydrofolate cyclodeaminase
MYPEHTVAEFLEKLASAAPEPGGGAAAALAGAAGAALVSMVANLTVGKPRYASAQADMETARARADALRAELLAEIDRDSDAFRAVMRAYGLPRSTEAEQAVRRQALQVALRTATEPPARVIRLCREVAAWSKVVAESGSAQAVSDAAVAAILADGAAQSAALNVRANLKAIADAAFGQQTQAAVQADLDAIRDLRDEVLGIVDRRMG